MTSTRIASFANASRVEVQHTPGGTWQVIGRGYSGRILAVANTDTREQALRLAATVTRP